MKYAVLTLLISLNAFSANNCPRVKIIVLSEQEFGKDPRDMPALKSAKVRCAQIYRNSPCLKKLTKRAPGEYQAICGR